MMKRKLLRLFKDFDLENLISKLRNKIINPIKNQAL